MHIVGRAPASFPQAHMRTAWMERLPGRSAQRYE
ncbi:MAG: hypothetical protein KatS3mg119_0861 [Rhodothalassiaceae bacterium]|nr:MAG: hypothetical protein KatS3mg119_0861 [Rhodothalassiaceae bacterium]